MSFNLFFTSNKCRTSIALSYFGILLPIKNFEISFSDPNDTLLQVKTAISGTKKTKQQSKYLIEIQKLLKKTFYSLPQTISVDFVCLFL